MSDSDTAKREEPPARGGSRREAAGDPAPAVPAAGPAELPSMFLQIVGAVAIGLLAVIAAQSFLTARDVNLVSQNLGTLAGRLQAETDRSRKLFDEIVILLWLDGAKEQILAHSPSGKVPVLRHDDLVVWESLAICEHLAEAFPDAGLWPADPAARAAARSASHEMHAGFMALRRAMPMNCRATKPGRGMADGVAADIERVGAIWRDCRERFGAGGALLFGGFTIADAMFAPIASRFRTYGVALDPVSTAYVQAVHALPAMRSWIAAAEAEPQTVDQFEI